MSVSIVLTLMSLLSDNLPLTMKINPLVHIQTLRPGQQDSFLGHIIARRKGWVKVIPNDQTNKDYGEWFSLSGQAVIVTESPSIV